MFIEQVLRPSRELLVTAKACMALLHLQGYHAILVIVIVSKCHSWHNYFLRTFSCPANEHIFTILQRQFFHSAQKSYLVVACGLWCLRSQAQVIFYLSECMCVCWDCSYFWWYSFSPEKKMRLVSTIKIMSLNVRKSSETFQ